MLCVWVRWGRVAGASELSLVVGGVCKIAHVCLCLDHLEFGLWLSFSSGGDELLVYCRVSVLLVHLGDALPALTAVYLLRFCTAKAKHQFSPG